MISEAPKCTKTNFFPGLHPNPSEELTPRSLAGGEGAARSSFPALEELGFAVFRGFKITNFNDFTFVLGMTVFGQVGLRSQRGPN